MKSKQFTARNPHSRSASIGRNLNKLSDLTNGSNTSLNTSAHVKPSLNRSKSSDGLPRRSKSLTKLSSLHPMKKSNSQQLDLTNMTKIINKEETPVAEEDDTQTSFNDHEVTEEVDNFSDDDPEQIEHKQEREPEQILSYKTPSQFSHTLIKAGSSFSSESRSHSAKVEENGNENIEKVLSFDGNKLAELAKKLRIQPQNTTEKKAETKIQTTLEAKQEDDLNTIAREPEIFHPVPAEEPNLKIDKQNLQEVQEVHQPKFKSKEDLKNDQYYSDMILSQSTGVVRAFGDHQFQNSLLNIQNKHQDSLQYIHSNDHISSSNFKSNSSSVNSLRPFTMNQQLLNSNAKLSTSNDSSSALSFKADPIVSLKKSKSKDSTHSTSGTPTNFNQFLRSNNYNIETRTQQKLWLQRENSLLDFSGLNTTNQTNPQIRREFEKVSKEYLNLRRFNNPILDSVKRTTTGAKKISSTTSSSLHAQQQTQTTPDLLVSIKSDSDAKLTKLWIESDTSSKQQREYLNNHHPRQHPLQHPQQRPITVQTQSTFNGIYNNSAALRSPVAPSTRAVDRANNTPENKRIDLSAIRLQEVEQLQKLA